MAGALIPASVSFAHPHTVALYSPEQAERVWKVRESVLGASIFVPGEESGWEGWEGWEDSAVPPEFLGQYLRELFLLIEHYGCPLNLSRRETAHIADAVHP
jgi:hypothetical protein